ncbi:MULTISPECIES: ribonuclease activity regulator RraA [unclassified Nocardioides]|uniref:ribonuclease activity regulator RraA n=1 Tax=unclassified Nocardioides TaxID=2615069 RepID=UPI000056F568|nr:MULTISPECIES: ribonuclease activity regulator RraA [unclassified Nocardioides]ABL79588.1 Dimethylmenaquinone methyltransferase [Nocardioides sp. JS614]
MTPLDDDVRELLGSASTATITTQLFRRGLRNAFLHGLRPLNPAAARLVAEAVTLRYVPAREDLDTLSAFDDYDHPQRRAIETVGPGQVLVMDCRGRGRAASAGEILATRLQVRGASGLITDGSVRDSHRIAASGLPCFTASVSATTNLALHHAVDINVPIGCADVAVYPGDVMVADEEGVVCIPRHLAEDVAVAAAAQERHEAYILAKVAAGAPLRGTYPPDAPAKAEYRRWAQEEDA